MAGGGFGSRFLGGTSTTPAAPGKPAGGFGSNFITGPTVKPKSSGGFLGKVGHVLAQTGEDVYHAAVNTPAGVYYLGKGLATHPIRTAEQVGKSTLGDFEHPLRHPGNTLLDVLGVLSAGAGTAARIGAVSKALEEGAAVGDVAKAALTRPTPPPRAFKVGDATVKGDYSRAPLTRAVQKGTDTLLAKGHEKNPTGTLGQLHERRFSKALQLNTRFATEAAKGPAAELQAVGRKLKPEEQMALHVVAKEAPVDARIAAHNLRLHADISNAERARHTERIGLLEKAKPYLTTDAAGLPKLKDPKLQSVFDKMSAVASGREDLLKRIDALSSDAIAQHKTEALRANMGLPLRENGQLPLSYEPAKVEDLPDHALRARLDKLDSGYQSLLESAMGGKPGDYKAVTAIQNAGAKKLARKGLSAEPTVREQLVSGAEKGLLETMRRHPDHPAVKALQAKLDEADRIRAELARRGDVGLGLTAGRPGPKIAPLPVASPNAVHVPEKVTSRGVKSLGKIPGLGQQGTIGHTRAPASLTAGYEGTATARALNRVDTTRLVAEANLEAQKYGAVLHVKDIIKGALHPVPQAADDVFVRLDKLKPHQATPLPVRRFIDNPSESFVHPTERAQHFADFLKEQFIPRKQMTPADQAEFEKLAKAGKGGWVSKTILGDFAKPQAPLAATLGKTTGAIDAINNASRFAILYLKPAYAAPNILGNVALNLIQQGPIGLARTLRDTSKLSFSHPDVTARIDALMGEGVAQSIAGETGRGTRVVQGAANVWSRGVDTPFRRSAFVYEARKAGYTTPDELHSLLTDPGKQDELLGVTRRANREIIDYGRLGPKEREVVRRVVFFYPWVKGSTMYAGHLTAEHPITAAALGQIGKIGHQDATAALGPVPSYLEGSFPVGGKLVNPTSAAILQTPAQVADALAGLATGNASKVAALSNFVTPAANLAAAEVFRRNPSTGIGYPGGKNAAAIGYDQLVKNLPLYSLYSRIHDASQGKGAGKLYPPNTRDALLQYLIGGLAPRKYNPSELARLYSREQTQIRTGR